MSNNRVVWLTADDPPTAFPPVDDRVAGAGRFAGCRR